MTNDPILIPPVVHQATEPPAVQPAIHHQARLATEEEIRAADQLFAKQQQEQQTPPQA